MALGLPIVSTNVGGLPYLIEDQKDGLLVEKENSLAMVNKILEIIRENNSYLAKIARIKAERFDCNNVKNKWVEILK